jgi:cytochrome P450
MDDTDDTICFGTRSAVERVLHDAAFRTPPAPATLRPGAAADLRAAMARFSDGEAHGPRRAAVDAALAGLDTDALRAAAAEAARRRPAGGASAVTTEVLARAFGAADHEVAGLVADVGRMVAVIFRGEPSGPAADEAVARVVDRFAGHPAGAVAVASVLYQAHDATAGLVAALLAGRERGGNRSSAGVRTRRVAAADADVGGTPVAAGATVVLDLAAADLEFGAGPHRCPGREVAEAIAAGIVSAGP